LHRIFKDVTSSSIR